MSTHAPLESQWNTLPETRSPTLYENSSYSAESAPWLSATVSVMARAATEREGAASL